MEEEGLHSGRNGGFLRLPESLIKRNKKECSFAATTSKFVGNERKRMDRGRKKISVAILRARAAMRKALAEAKRNSATAPRSIEPGSPAKTAQGKGSSATGASTPDGGSTVCLSRR